MCCHIFNTDLEMLLSFVFSLNWPTGPIQPLSGYVCQSRNVPLQAIVSKGLLLLVSLFGNGGFGQKKRSTSSKKCHKLPKKVQTIPNVPKSARQCQKVPTHCKNATTKNCYYPHQYFLLCLLFVHIAFSLCIVS